MRDPMSIPLTLWVFLLLSLIAAVAYGVAWAVKWRPWRGVDPEADRDQRAAARLMAAGTADRYGRLGYEEIPTVQHGERDAAIRLRQSFGPEAATKARQYAVTGDVQWARVAQLLETQQV